MASPLYPPRPRPPRIYRAARALRRTSLLVLVAVILYVGFVAFSAVQVAKTAPRVGASSVALEENDTVGIATSFTLSNPSLLPIQQFGLEFRVLNGTGFPLVASSIATTTIPGGASVVLPVALFIPVSTGGASLLTENQYLDWNVWGNASYGYLFSVSIGVQTQKAWGAPFDNVSVVIGAPGHGNGSASIPVTLAFANDASFADAGDLNFQVVPASGPVCADGSFLLNVPAGSPYSQTEAVPLASGCNPAGGHVDAEFVGNGFSISMPPEPIP
ncbi:MAG: hypothetical protein ACREEC_12025 [Thermoplasmata archaeon]